MIEDEKVGWHHRLYGHEFGQAPGVDNGQGSLTCYSPWVAKSQTGLERISVSTCAKKRRGLTLVRSDTADSVVHRVVYRRGGRKEELPPRIPSSAPSSLTSAFRILWVHSPFQALDRR